MRPFEKRSSGVVQAIGRCAIALGSMNAASLPAQLAAQNYLNADSAAALILGSADGQSEYLFDGITGIIRVGDGRFVVGNCGTGEIRLYSESGQHLRTTGRVGEGPGEFSQVARLFRAGGDTIAIWDRSLRRLTLLDSELNAERSFSVHQRIEPRGRLPGGAFIGTITAIPRDLSFDPDGQLIRRPVVLVAFDEAGTVDSIAQLPGHESWVWGRGSSMGHSAYRSTSLAVIGARLAVGSQDSTVYTILEPTGEATEHIRTITAPLAVTSAMRDEYAELLATAGPTQEAADRMRTNELSREWPPTLPAYGTFYADIDGGLWVQDPFRVGVHPTRWTRYENGTAEAQVTLPPRFWPLDFGRRWVIGVSLDDMGVQRVTRFELTSSDGPSTPTPYDSSAAFTPQGSRAGCFLPTG